MGRLQDVAVDVVEQMNTFMEKLGFERHQVPVALLGYNVLLWAEYGSTAGRQFRERMRTKYNLYDRFEKRIEKQAGRVAENRFVKPLTNFFKVSSNQIVTTTVEAGVLYNVSFFPVLLPGNVFLLKRYFAWREKRD